ncbi:hypothetical protein BV25DRAFT_1866564 [Artomyces pyxidatus]|uniref:Uncharacterized protein n=1 Tax=Artomyces pyxidatus TaxID=48021 RepID=A0ACB8TJK9_9AGAM|nr:hypothetical protein BV25DRAFT_1866564 [Artomyces pyxidatus]
MIQKLNGRSGSTAIAPYRQSTSTNDRGPESWGTWLNRRFYSLEVVQQPIRARMCGFGDKDRRPLAPATIAKLVIRNDDNSLVNEDEIDCSFFLATADLWSADGTAERNLVLHPTSSDRYITTHAPKKRRSNAHLTPPQPPGDADDDPGQTTHTLRPIDHNQANNGILLAPAYNAEGHPYPHAQQPSTSDSITLHLPPSYPGSGNSDWPSFSTAHRSHPSSVPAANPRMHPSPPSETWHPADRSSSGEADAGPYGTWSSTPQYTATESASSAIGGTALALQTVELRGSGHAAWTQPGSPAPRGASYTTTGVVAGLQNPPYGESQYASYGQRRAQAASVSPISPLPGHAYTRTLVGPLSANACRLLDEHRRPGVFFLFQDLSIRTEGSFRLRLRLMNIGAPPAPSPGASRVHTDVSPVLAQTYTEPFDVYSAKRFPGVPDTTALSIAFGNQGQKLPLRNRHGSTKGRRRRRGDSDGSDEDSDGAS